MLFLRRRRRALFFDRDGTLNVNAGEYIGDPQKIVLCPHAREILHGAHEANYLIFLVTNQSAVSRGYFPIDSVHACNQRLIELIGISDIFDGIAISTGTAQNPDPYRKPSPKFMEEMFLCHGIKANDCLVIGDSTCDMQLAMNAHSRGLLVKNGGNVYLSKEEEKFCLGRFKHLGEVWRFIERHHRKT